MKKSNGSFRVEIGRVADRSWSNSYPITLYGVRLEGTDGWFIGEKPFDLGEIEANLRASGYRVLEIREISSGRGFSRKEDGSPDIVGVGSWLAKSHGWAFDEVAEVWRAPGEALSTPPGIPTAVGEVQVSFGRPDAGWLPVRIVAGRESLQFDASEVYDPFPGLLRWLEEIVQGRHPRFAIDIEGSYVDLMIFPRENDATIRFLAGLSGNVMHGGRREVHVDIAATRRAIVEAFYGSLRAFSLSADYVRHEWASEQLGEALALALPSLRKEDLTGFSSGFLDGLFWAVAPRFEADYGDLPPSERMRRFADYVIDGAPAPVLRPVIDFRVASDFDSWDRECRMQYLDELLKERHNSWRAVDLRTLRSEEVERWLNDQLHSA